MQPVIIDACLVCDNPFPDDADVKNALKACGRCGHVFDSPRPATADIVAFYSRSEQYDRWIDDARSRDRLWQRRVAKLRERCRPGSLLDVGAGIGQFLDHARYLFNEVFGTEVSSSAVDIAKERYHLSLSLGELSDISFDRAFDNITMFHVLEHVPDPKATLLRCATLLAPGGMLFIAVPNDIESLKQRAKVLLGRLRIERYAIQGRLALPKITLDGTMPEIHLSHFTTSSLSCLLEATGFEVVDSSIDPYSVAVGKQRLLDTVLRVTAAACFRVTRTNFYDAIWMVGRRTVGPG
jgi:SAM-dependent methyltransferase